MELMWVGVRVLGLAQLVDVAGADLENKGLVQVSEQGDGGCSAVEVMSALADASVPGSAFHVGDDL